MFEAIEGLLGVYEFKNLYVDGTSFADALGFGTTAMTVPTADGSSGQTLITNGSGVLSWSSLTGITSTQAAAITANTAKTGITSDQAAAIVANTAKTGITSTQITFIDGITSTKRNSCRKII